MRKKILFIAGGIILVFVLLLPFILQGLNKTPEEQMSPSLPPTVTLTPQEDLRIVSISPPQDLSVKRLPIQQFGFVFSLPVSPEEFSYSITPDIDVSIRQGEDANTIILSAQDVWPINTTITITVNAATKTSSGKNLVSTYSYSFIADYPEMPPLDPSFEY